MPVNSSCIPSLPGPAEEKSSHIVLKTYDTLCLDNGFDPICTARFWVASKQPGKILFSTFSLSFWLQTGAQKKWTYTLRLVIECYEWIERFLSHTQADSWIKEAGNVWLPQPFVGWFVCGTAWASLISWTSGLHLSLTSKLLQFSPLVPSMQPSSLNIDEVWEFWLLLDRNDWLMCLCSCSLQFTGKLFLGMSSSFCCIH